MLGESLTTFEICHLSVGRQIRNLSLKVETLKSHNIILESSLTQKELELKISNESNVKKSNRILQLEGQLKEAHKIEIDRSSLLP